MKPLIAALAFPAGVFSLLRESRVQLGGVNSVLIGAATGREWIFQRL
jgi:hypothetical protein